MSLKYNNNYLFAIFGEKDCSETRFNVFWVYSTANTVTTSTFGPKLLPQRVSIVKPRKTEGMFVKEDLQ